MSQKQQIQHLLKQRQLVLIDLAQKLTKVVTLRKSKQTQLPTQIIKNLFIGSYTSAVNQKILLEHKIKNIVSCIGHLPVPYPDQSINALKLSFKDSSSESIESYLNESFEFIEKALESDEAVFVHCFKGVSRSSALVIGYLIRKFGIGADEAFEMLKEKYPQGNPNKGFMNQLKFLGERYQKQKQQKEQNVKIISDEDIMLKEDIGQIQIKKDIQEKGQIKDNDNQNLLEISETKQQQVQTNLNKQTFQQNNQEPLQQQQEQLKNQQKQSPIKIQNQISIEKNPQEQVREKINLEQNQQQARQQSEQSPIAQNLIQETNNIQAKQSLIQTQVKQQQKIAENQINTKEETLDTQKSEDKLAQAIVEKPSQSIEIQKISSPVQKQQDTQDQTEQGEVQKQPKQEQEQQPNKKKKKKNKKNKK